MCVISELQKDLKTSESIERGFKDERKALTAVARMRIAENIQTKYSLLRGQKGVFNEQLFSAMDEYLKECEESGRRYEGL